VRQCCVVIAAVDDPPQRLVRVAEVAKVLADPELHQALALTFQYVR
jgi:hypothetical protein